MVETLVEIPKALIYEMIDGKPIYYKGYKKVLDEELKIQEVMGCSSLQAMIFSIVMRFLNRNIDFKEYVVTGNEAGLHLAKNQNLSSDIVIYEKSALKSHPINKKYFDFPPKIVIEIDVQAETEEFEAFESDIDYIYTKTKKLLDFGVEKVVWIFTESKQLTVATREKPWLTYDWENEIVLFEDYTFNLANLVEESELF